MTPRCVPLVPGLVWPPSFCPPSFCPPSLPISRLQNKEDSEDKKRTAVDDLQRMGTKSARTSEFKPSQLLFSAFSAFYWGKEATAAATFCIPRSHLTKYSGSSSTCHDFRTNQDGKIEMDMTETASQWSQWLLLNGSRLGIALCSGLFRPFCHMHPKSLVL